MFYPLYYNPETRYDPKTLASETVYWFRIKGYKKGYIAPDIRYFEILIPRQREETREKDRIYRQEQEQLEDEAYAKKQEKALKSQRERMEESQRERIKESQNREMERKRVEDIEKENKNQELERRRVKELERIRLAKENEYKESERKRVDDIEKEKEKEKEIVNKQVNTTGPSYFNKALNWLSSNPPSRLNF